MDTKKMKIDPKKVEYDGHSFRLIIENESSFLERLKQKQAEMIRDLEDIERDRPDIGKSSQKA